MQSQLPASLSLPPNSGYGVQHLQYAAQCDHWARVAHRPPPAEAISLEISALYENGSKRKGARGTPFGVSIFFFVYLCSSPIKPDVVVKSICEGLKDIPAVAPAAELVVMALETITPRIKAYDPRFAWHECEFIVRDAKWVDLSRHPSSDPYFYADCLHPSTRKNSKATVFKSKQFSLHVVIPERQWMEYEAFKEKSELPPDWDTSKQRAKPQRRASTVTTSLSTASSQAEGPAPSIATSSRSSLFDRSSTSEVASLRTMNKRQHAHSSSISSLSGLSPPHKKQVSTMLLNPNDLKDALQSGGGTDLDLARGK